MRSFYQLALFLSVFLLLCSLNHAQFSPIHENPLRIRHRHSNKLDNMIDAQHKRDANVAFTYFDDGQGACGAMNGPNDFIVALSSAEFDGGAHCFEMITITINGKTAQAQITDECLGCMVGGLDFSQGLFEYFAPLSVGELYGSWDYNSGVATSSSTPSPSTTSYISPATTAFPLSSTSSSTKITTPSVSTASTIPTLPTSTPQDPQIVVQINLALLELGVLLQASLKLEN